MNRLSAARFFLFGSRDVWFVVALPVYLQAQLDWEHTTVGVFMALWVVGYGFVQTIAPKITGMARGTDRDGTPDGIPDGIAALQWSVALCFLPLLIAVALYLEFAAGPVLVIGLLVFGAVFAINSSVHSYLIVSYAKEEGVTLDVGFYYMANAAGRLVGTLLSGGMYQWVGLEACLIVSTVFIALTSLVSIGLPRNGEKERLEGV